MYFVQQWSHAIAIRFSLCLCASAAAALANTATVGGRVSAASRPSTVPAMSGENSHTFDLIYCMEKNSVVLLLGSHADLTDLLVCLQTCLLKSMLM